MPSAVECCNVALYRAGGEPIVQLEDNNVSAIDCRRLLPIVRRSVIIGHRWNFSTKRAVIATVTTTPEFGWNYAYQKPPKCLRVWEVDKAGADDWAVEGDTIVTDLAAPLHVVYAIDVEDIAVWPQQAFDVLAMALAVELALPRADSMGRRQALLKELTQITWPSAKRLDALEGASQARADGSWIEARL